MFVIDFANTFGFDVRAFLADPPFEWDYVAAARKSHVLRSVEPEMVRSCTNLVNDQIPVLQIDYMICEENYFLWDDPKFAFIANALKEEHPYFVHGIFSQYLFRPSFKIARCRPLAGLPCAVLCPRGESCP